MSANSKEAVLVAGELADIELPVAPPTDWGWLVSLLGWSILLFLLAVLLLWILRNSQVLKGSVLVFWLRASWQLKSIEKSMALNEVGESSANRADDLGLKKQAGLLYKWCQDVQNLSCKIEADYLAGFTTLKSEANITKTNVDFNDINQQITDLKDRLQFVLFAEPAASRETLTQDLQHSVKLAYKILEQLPWQQWLKMQLSSSWWRTKGYLKSIKTLKKDNHAG